MYVGWILYKSNQPEYSYVMELRDFIEFYIIIIDIGLKNSKSIKRNVVLLVFS